jgi:uncharacterized protein (DUF1778 family)
MSSQTNERNDKKTKNERVEIRIATKRKNTIQRAVQYVGAKSTSEFMIEASYAKALQVIERQERILQNEEDQEIFFNALFETEQKPNEELLALSKQYYEANENGAIKHREAR